MDATLLHIQPAAPQPIYRQIAEQIRRLVAGGPLVDTEKGRADDEEMQQWFAPKVHGRLLQPGVYQMGDV